MKNTLNKLFTGDATQPTANAVLISCDLRNDIDIHDNTLYRVNTFNKTRVLGIKQNPRIMPVPPWAYRLDYSKPHRAKFPTNAIFLTTLWMRAKSIHLIFPRPRETKSCLVIIPPRAPHKVCRILENVKGTTEK